MKYSIFTILILSTLSIAGSALSAVPANTITHFKCKAPTLSTQHFEFRIKNLESGKKATFVHYEVDGEMVNVATFNRNGRDITSGFGGDFGCFNGQGYSNGPGMGKDSKGNEIMVLTGDCDGFTYFTLQLYKNSGYKNGFLTDSGSERKGYWKVSCEVTEE